MNDLTVISVLWTGQWSGRKYRPYSPIWVSRLKSMVEKYLDQPFNFICLTNEPADKFEPGIHVIPLIRDRIAWWNKMEIFRLDLPVAKRVLYLDLDILVVNDLLPMVKLDSEFALYNVWSFSNFPRHAVRQRIERYKKKTGKVLNHVYSSCVMVFDKGMYPCLFDELTVKEMNHFAGDQDWISHCIGKHQRMFPENWGRNLLPQDRGCSPSDFGEAKLLACRHPIKNHLLGVEGYDWADKLWRGENGSTANSQTAR